MTQPASFTSKTNAAPAATARRFNSAVWRWHFYAGICVIPFVFILAISGLAMLASEPIDRLLRADLFEVTPNGSPLPPAEQAAAVAAAYPNSRLVTFRVADAAEQSTAIDVEPKAASSHSGHGDSETRTVYVDPYTGQILGERAADDTLYAWAKGIHGTLLLGTVGDYVIEIAAGFTVLLVVTGLFLWWPRDGCTVRAALLPNLAAGRGRRRWRDVHGAVGAWIAPVLVFFLVSGLAWTPFWGGELVQAWSSLPGEGFDVPPGNATHGSLDHGAHRTIPWAVEQTPLPAAGSPSSRPGIAASHAIAIDDVVGYARAAGFDSFRVHWPRGEGGVWTVATTTIAGDTRNPAGDRIVHLDPSTGNVLAEIRFADYSPMGKFMAAGIPLHQGDTGAANLIVNVVFCLAVLGLGGAGLAAWWARRPARARWLVPPPLPRDPKTWSAAVVLMLALSLVFPLVAATIAVVLTVDLLLLSRVRALRALFE